MWCDVYVMWIKAYHVMWSVAYVYAVFIKYFKYIVQTTIIYTHHTSHILSRIKHNNISLVFDNSNKTKLICHSLQIIFIELFIISLQHIFSSTITHSHTHTHSNLLSVTVTLSHALTLLSKVWIKAKMCKAQIYKPNEICHTLTTTFTYHITSYITSHHITSPIISYHTSHHISHHITYHITSHHISYITSHITSHHIIADELIKYNLYNHIQLHMLMWKLSLTCCVLAP